MVNVYVDEECVIAGGIGVVSDDGGNGVAVIGVGVVGGVVIGGCV